MSLSQVSIEECKGPALLPAKMLNLLQYLHVQL